MRSVPTQCAGRRRVRRESVVFRVSMSSHGAVELDSRRDRGGGDEGDRCPGRRPRRAPRPWTMVMGAHSAGGVAAAGIDRCPAPLWPAGAERLARSSSGGVPRAGSRRGQWGESTPPWVPPSLQWWPSGRTRPHAGTSRCWRARNGDETITKGACMARERAESVRAAKAPSSGEAGGLPLGQGGNPATSLHAEGS